MIEIGKTYQTTSGYPVRIFCTDGGGTYPVIGAVFMNGAWQPLSWTSEGFFNRVKGLGSSHDLVEVKSKCTVTFWGNVYPIEDGFYIIAHRTKERADDNYSRKRVACLEFTREFSEGEGLDENHD